MEKKAWKSQLSKSNLIFCHYWPSAISTWILELQKSIWCKLNCIIFLTQRPKFVLMFRIKLKFSQRRNVYLFLLSASWPRNYKSSFTDLKTLFARHMLSCQIPYGLGVEKLLFMVFNGWFLRKYLFLNASVVYQLLIASPIAGVEISWWINRVFYVMSCWMTWLENITASWNCDVFHDHGLEKRRWSSGSEIRHLKFNPPG